MLKHQKRTFYCLSESILEQVFISNILEDTLDKIIASHLLV